MDIGRGVLMGALRDSAGGFLRTFGPNRYEPLVPASWPQNNLSMTNAFVPDDCELCHVQGVAGRFPHLSNAFNLSNYCATILPTAVAGNPMPVAGTMPVRATMPPGREGLLATDSGVVDLRGWCNIAASAGPANRGDPHLSTTNGIHYDFQAAGEFTALRNSDTGFELQTRQSPVLTSTIPGANPYTGLASCVSLNTAAALRIDKHRVTYQPGPSLQGKPAPMQLRIDGKPADLGPGGIALGAGNRITHAGPGGGLDVRLVDGTRVLVSPNLWASEGYWYLDVEVLNTPAREGTMGHVRSGDWLPLAPNGATFGPRPGPIAARDWLLNRTFADAWRVTGATSLFDYAPGTSTASFTQRNWPPPSGSACTAVPGGAPLPGLPRPPVKPIKAEAAKKLCRFIADRAAREECVFDVTVMGDAGVAEGYRRTLELRRAAAAAP